MHIQGEHQLMLKEGDQLHALGSSSIVARCESENAAITVMASDSAHVTLRGVCWHLEILRTSGMATIDGLDIHAEDITVADVAGNSTVRVRGNVHIGTIRDTALVHVLGTANTDTITGRGRIIVLPDHS
jgi:hypothetical protein